MGQNPYHLTNLCSIDKAHDDVDIFAEDIVQYVWKTKYRFDGEASVEDTFDRVCRGVYAHEPSTVQRDIAYDAMCKGLWVPGGRILAGAGTTKQVTQINCYVSQTIDDSMSGIADALKDAMLTMQQGGGIGMDFSTLRPTGATLNRTGAIASGPLPFMDMWDSMCKTIMSAGARRGAMMGTIHCEHPDLIKFIEAKNEAGRLVNFNVSVLITDAFLDAVQSDETWHLGFGVPKSDGSHLFTVERDDGDIWYAYSEHKARDLWDAIIKHTYEYSEPGVIFIDRINDYNNLKYCETIAATNPCGEQPLPPYGACNLGAINLARLVTRPFTERAEFDWINFRRLISMGVRFLDNVIDTTLYPLEEQHKEEVDKRRIGLGITGLADALVELGMTYGTEEALSFTHTVMDTLKDHAYLASAYLAEERGSFPLYDSEQWGFNTPVVTSLPMEILEVINTHGIRNGVLLTIAPTGTTSLLLGNVSSGLEPIFELEYNRKVRQQDETIETYEVIDYAYQLWRSLNPFNSAIPSEFVGIRNLSVTDHVRMQAVCQESVDASISKTINCPPEMSFDEFKLMYWDAYELGCKGCTTYRPSDVRGSVLELSDAKTKSDELVARPSSLTGKTYKLKWGNAAYYLTINDLEGKPFEVFLSSTSGKYADWQTALSLMISAVMRKGGNIDFISEELKKVVSMTDYAWVQGTFYGSLVALIGHTLEQHIASSSTISNNSIEDNTQLKLTTTNITGSTEVTPAAGSVQEFFGDFCPQCNQPTLQSREGCKICISCGYSNCG